LTNPFIQFADTCVPKVTNVADCLNFVCPTGYSGVAGSTVSFGGSTYCSCFKLK